MTKFDPSSAREALVAQIPALRRYARFLTGEPSRADDLVQDCLARALLRLHLWRPGNLRAWLFSILVNLHRDALRRGAMEASFDPEIILSTLGGGNQHDALAARQTLDRLKDLPTDQREVLLMVAIEGLSYDEIATIQDIPVGTVMSRLSRARARLRQIDEGQPPLKRVK